MSSRRPRHVDDEYGDNDDAGTHRSKDSHSKRPPTPDNPDSPTNSRSQRRSILRDPDEDPKDRAARRSSRSNSQVRLKPPPSAYPDSDGDNASIDGRYVKHRNGEVEFIPTEGRKREPKKRTHDLEQKTGDRNSAFRAKRDGYESDEGNQLRKSKLRSRGDSIGDVDSDVDARPKGRSSHGRGSKNDDAFAIPDRTRRRAGSAAPDNYPNAGRRRDAPRRRDDSDEDDYAPRRPRPVRKSYDADHDRGYDTEGAGRRRRGWDDDDYDDRRPRRSEVNRRPVRYDDDYPPPRRPAARDDRLRPPPPRYSRYDDGDPYDRRDRYEERPIRRARSDARARDRDPRARDPRDKKNEWAKQAGAVFMSQAMPYIKKEGSKWARKELESWMAQRRQ